jgi:seryl-tRNA synthetase
MAAPQSRKPGSVKDMSKDRADSKKNVTQEKARLANEWAKKNRGTFDEGSKAFDAKTPVVQKLKALHDKFKDDDEKRKKINDQTEEILNLLQKIAKKVAKTETEVKTLSEVKSIGPMPKVAPPAAADIVAVLAWCILWQAWIAAVRKAFK